MEWKANHRNAPLYIWKGDTWFNETDKKVYTPNLLDGRWESENVFIPFRKNTRIIDNK